jgi:MFS family permease
VLVPLIASDITRGTGRFNVVMGLLGLAIGAAAASSTFIGGMLADHELRGAFEALAAAGALGVELAWRMPETRA